MGADNKKYYDTIEKYRRQRQKIRNYLDYVDSEKEGIFKEIEVTKNFI